MHQRPCRHCPPAAVCLHSARHANLHPVCCPDVLLLLLHCWHCFFQKGRCNYATKLKFYFNVDDGLDVFALHGIGGYAGNVMTGLFAADYVAHLDGVTVIPGGWIQHNWIQLGYQLAGATA